MRPIKLTMQAFANYAEKQVIDFTELNSRNMFLITGKTGAGKTTIFDAISYALFGDTSGEFRDVPSLRSDYADGSIQTFVELEFEVRGELYKIRRSPQQLLNKKRGEGQTLADGEVEFILPKEERPLTKIKSVNEKVEEVLGVNIKQFRQIVMLPQGEFIKFLKSNSGEREIIFRQIFGTYMFNSIQAKLNEKSKALKKNLESDFNSRNILVKGISAKEESVLKVEIENTNANIEKVLELTNELIQSDNKLLATSKCEMEKNTAAIKSLEDKSRTLKNEEQVIANYINCEKELKEQESKTQIVDEYRIKLEKGRKAFVVKTEEDKLKKATNDLSNKKVRLEGLKKEIEIFTTNLEETEKGVELQKVKDAEREKYLIEIDNLAQKENKLSDYETKKAKGSELLKELSKFEQQYKDKESELLNLEKEREVAQAYVNNASNFKAEIVEVLNLGKEKKAQIEKLESIVKKYELLDNDIASLNSVRKEFDKLETEFNLAKNNFERAEDNYKKAQAGILAESLIDGEECPVCGSKNHPKKAIKASDILSEAEIKKLKVAFEKARDDKDKKLIEHGRANSKFETSKANLFDEIKAEEVLDNSILNDESLVNQKESITNIISKLNKEKNELLAKYQNLNKNVKEFDIKKEFVEKSVDKINEIKRLVDSYKQNFDKIKDEFTKISENIKGIENEIPKELRDKGAIVAQKTKFEMLSAKILKDNELVKKQYEIDTKKLAGAQEAFRHTNTDIEDASKYHNECKLSFANALKTQGFTVEEYKLAINVQDLDEIESKIKLFDNRLNSLKGVYSVAKIAFDKLEFTEVEKLKESIEKTENEIKVLTEKNSEFIDTLNVLSGRIANNTERVKEILVINERIKDDDKKHSHIEYLAAVASGKGGNLKKMTFESYILTSYFDKIIVVANQRLNKMTNGRFELRRSEEVSGNGKQGLDLNILDNNTGRERGVNSLSGGETFKTALAIALGLADVIQSYSGGVSIETMFIDEGFGTLDPESLDTAIGCLLDLQQVGRLIGVISHVQELKERIDARLEVKLRDDNRGSVANFIIK